MNKRPFILLTILLLLLAACGGGDDEQNNNMPEPGELITTESGLQYEILEVGDGDKPQMFDYVHVHYTGTLEDGTQFDSSYDRGIPFTFQLGMGGVIKGWDEGIGYLTEGSKARLIIPPELGYGDRDQGVIPPNSTLIFEVELVQVGSE